MNLIKRVLVALAAPVLAFVVAGIIATLVLLSTGDDVGAFWTTLATCAQQGRSAFEFLHHSIVAQFTDQPFPSLLALPP